MIYVNKIENRITFKIKAGYYLELLTPENMQLLGSTKSNITKDENGENVPHLKINEVLLVYCDIATTFISKIQEFCIHLFLIIWSIIRYFSQEFYIFKNF